MSGNLPSAHESSGHPVGTGRQLVVCHIASGDLWAGAEVQVASLLRQLATRADLRLRAIFLNEGRLAEEARQAGVEVLVVPESQYGFWATLRRAAEFLGHGEVDVLHSHRYKENLLAALLARRCAVPRVVRSQHGLPEPPPAWKQWKHRLLHAADNWVGRRATDRVISVSREMQQHLAREVGAEKVIVIHNGIDVERIGSRLSPAEAKQRLGLPAEAAVVGTAGRLVAVKRLDIFLAAATEIIRTHGGARFLVAGEGRERERLQALARELGLEGSVLFLGHRDDIYDVLRAMDVFLLTSDHEGLPMVLLEAPALGVPVVARRVGGVAEVVEDGVSGLLVDSADPQTVAASCLRLLADPAARERMGQRGKELVAGHFSAQKAGEEVARLYHALATGS